MILWIKDVKDNWIFYLFCLFFLPMEILAAYGIVDDDKPINELMMMSLFSWSVIIISMILLISLYFIVGMS